MLSKECNYGCKIIIGNSPKPAKACQSPACNCSGHITLLLVHAPARRRGILGNINFNPHTMKRKTEISPCKRRSAGKKKKDRCFIYGRKGHFAKNFCQTKKKGMHMLRKLTRKHIVFLQKDYLELVFSLVDEPFG